MFDGVKMIGHIESTCWVGFHFNPMNEKINVKSFTFFGLKKVKTNKTMVFERFPFPCHFTLYETTSKSSSIIKKIY